MKTFNLTLLSALLLVSAEVAQEASEKKNCKLQGFAERPASLEMLDLTPKEKKEIAALSKRGRKIDAIRIMRRCGDMSLKEQKAIVDSLHSAY